MKRRLIALVMTLVLLLNGLSIVRAAENASENSDEENDISPNGVVILPDLIVDAGGKFVKLFSVHANYVTTQLNTYGVSDKYLTYDTFPGHDVYMKGQLSHSVTEVSIGPKIRAGIGNYISNGSGVYPNWSCFPTPGNEFLVKLCEKTNLPKNTNYYVFIDNYLGSGYVYGDIGVYYLE